MAAMHYFFVFRVSQVADREPKCQKPSGNSLETQGNPHSCSGNRNPPLIALTHPLRPYKAFTLHRAFRFWAQTPRRLHSIGRGNTQPLSTLSRQDSLTRALKTSCHLELKVRWLGINPHHSLQVDLWHSNPRGETPSA